MNKKYSCFNNLTIITQEFLHENWHILEDLSQEEIAKEILHEGIKIYNAPAKPEYKIKAQQMIQDALTLSHKKNNKPFICNLCFQENNVKFIICPNQKCIDERKKAY